MPRLNSRKIEHRIAIRKESDVYSCVETIRQHSRTLGFEITSQYLIATAVSELAMNIVKYANFGEVLCFSLSRENLKGIEIIALDIGPGIESIELALKDRFTTSKNGLGVGLSGVKRMVDEFDIESKVGLGTKITIAKWISLNELR